MTDAVRHPNTRNPRRRAREFAVQAIYEWLAKGAKVSVSLGEIDAHIQSFPEFSSADFNLFKSVFYGACREAETLRESFIPFLDRPLAELSLVEHAVLLLGSYEMAHQPDVPYKVIINECVELTKEFGSSDGFRYINGVLDKLAPQLRGAEVQATKR